jgi:hypothetical protein
MVNSAKISQVLELKCPCNLLSCEKLIPAFHSPDVRHDLKLESPQFVGILFMANYLKKKKYCLTSELIIVACISYTRTS